jgi:hypothetical protein
MCGSDGLAAFRNRTAASKHTMYEAFCFHQLMHIVMMQDFKNVYCPFSEHPRCRAAAWASLNCELKL